MYTYTPVKRVAIVGDKDVWFNFQDVIKEPSQERSFIWFIEDDEWTFVLRLGCVLKVLHISSYHLAVGDQVTLE